LPFAAAVLPFAIAGGIISLGPKRKIEDGPSYWLPGVPAENSSSGDEPSDPPGIGHNGGPALDQAGGQPSQEPDGGDPKRKPSLAPPTPVRPPEDSFSNDSGAAPRSTSEILMPNGKPVGYDFGRARPFSRTVTPDEFVQLHNNLKEGAVQIQTGAGYDGIWYKRSDGAVFGVRQSLDSGLTIDIIESGNSNVSRRFKVHQR
jgi:hypothetical protein